LEQNLARCDSGMFDLNRIGVKKSRPVAECGPSKSEENPPLRKLLVPENLRPSQETPDPDDDPTRKWREWSKGETRKRKQKNTPG
jgi:hypothetical protein